MTWREFFASKNLVIEDDPKWDLYYKVSLCGTKFLFSFSKKEMDKDISETKYGGYDLKYYLGALLSCM